MNDDMPAEEFAGFLDSVFSCCTSVMDSNTVVHWEVSRGDVTKYVHPTQKPLELLQIPIGNSSQRGDIVLDFFGDSGSTLMTCEQMDRTCRTLELAPVLCDVIKKRFYEYPGVEPVLLSETWHCATFVIGNLFFTNSLWFTYINP